MNRADLTEKLLDIKREKGWTWKYICEQIGGMSPVMITGGVLGQQKMTKSMAAAAAKHGHLGADVDGGAPLVDVTVAGVALQPRAGLRAEPRRVARLHAEDASRELLLADELGHAPVEHELDALLARAELQAARQRGAIPDRPGSGDLAGVGHEARGEMA